MQPVSHWPDPADPTFSVCFYSSSVVASPMAKTDERDPTVYNDHSANYQNALDIDLPLPILPVCNFAMLRVTCEGAYCTVVD